MCVGIPMKVINAGPEHAWCEGRSGRQRVNMMMLEPQPEGAWVLVFRDFAREGLSELDARRIDAALDALDAAQRGEQPDVATLFGDLIGQKLAAPFAKREAC